MARILQRQAASESMQGESSKSNWLRISIIANIVIVAFVAVGGASAAVIHQSDTNPNLCGSCHIMQENVQSYLTSNHLDNLHYQAGVECKGCHDYPVPAEIEAGINFVLGNYEITSAGNVPKREFDDAMCLQCHLGPEHLANQTDYLKYNPHLSHWDDLQCRNCHTSHGEQINLCAECHVIGTNQRMIEGPIVPRAENPWADPDRERPAASRS